MVALTPSPIQRFVDNNGNALNGGKLFVYLAGGTTKTTTYTDSTGATPQTNPIILNARGEPENMSLASVGIWLTAGVAVKFVLSPSTDTDPPTNPFWTIDNIIVPILAADVVLTFTGGPPTASQWLGGENIRRGISFLSNFSGSGGTTPKTLPGASFVVSIQKNGSQVGTATCSTGGAWTFSTTGAVSFAIGDVMDFIGPATPDSQVANFGLTLDGTLT